MKEHNNDFLGEIESRYQPITTLLSRRDDAIRIAPWDQLDLDFDTPSKTPHIDARQVSLIEQVMSVYHPGIKNKHSNYEWYPIDNYKRGELRGIDVHTGSIVLDSEEDLSPVETMFFQYVHNPREEYAETGQPVIDNDGVANVFLQSDGRIQAISMLPGVNSPILFCPFVPDNIRKNELAYPADVTEALRDIRSNHGRIDPMHLPLIGKLGILVTAAADIWLDRKAQSDESVEKLIKISGDINHFTVEKDSIDSRAATFFGAPVDEHPLTGLVDEELIPEKVDIIQMEGYEEFLKSAVGNGYQLPTFFRSHEMGVYFSDKSPFEDDLAGSHMREILGYNGVTDVSRGIIVPSEWPSTYKGDWSKPFSYLRHQLVLAAYEDLPENVRTDMINVCSESVEESVYLRNHTYLRTEIPKISSETPYAFRNYSRQQQEQILGGFIAGALTLNKDIFPYWRGPHLHGDGSSMWDWIPQEIPRMLEENGFHVDRAPQSRIHPLYVRGENRDGTPDMMDRPFANPDFKIDDSGTIFNCKLQ